MPGPARCVFLQADVQLALALGAQDPHEIAHSDALVGRLDLLRRLARDYWPHCIIELIWQACLTYDVESARIRDFAERELGIPYLRIETDYSTSDSARVAVRVEALFETVRRAVT